MQKNDPDTGASVPEPTPGTGRAGGGGPKWTIFPLEVGEAREMQVYGPTLPGAVDVVPAVRANTFERALKAICNPTEGSPFWGVYEEAGRGYEGLRAIAESALALVAERGW